MNTRGFSQIRDTQGDTPLYVSLHEFVICIGIRRANKVVPDHRFGYRLDDAAAEEKIWER